MSTGSPADGVGRVGAESFRASALAASLTVRDLQASLAWYRDVVGFAVDREYEREESCCRSRCERGT